jgi:hypothetical protein
VTPLHPPDNSEASATEQRDPERPAFSQSAAPLLQAAVILQAAASARQQSAPGEPQCCSRPDPIVCCAASARLLLFSHRRAPDDPNGGAASHRLAPISGGVRDRVRAQMSAGRDLSGENRSDGGCVNGRRYAADAVALA